MKKGKRIIQGFPEFFISAIRFKWYWIDCNGNQVYILDEGDRRILLGLKKRGFGVGNWNGFGGKVHLDESIRHGAVR